MIEALTHTYTRVFLVVVVVVVQVVLVVPALLSDRTEHVRLVSSRFNSRSCSEAL